MEVIYWDLCILDLWDWKAVRGLFFQVVKFKLNLHAASIIKKWLTFVIVSCRYRFKPNCFLPVSDEKQTDNDERLLYLQATIALN